MNIVIFGASGMLGNDLLDFLRSLNKTEFTIHGKTFPGHDIGELASPSRQEVDLTDRTKVYHYLTTMRSRGFNTVINCAAETDVGGIQSCVADEQNSYAVNALAPRYIAEACNSLKMRLIHISTDYVYSDMSLSTAMYHDEFPKNIYGYHKLIGELFIQNAMKSNYSIIRVGCLYGMNRGKSFIHKFLKNVSNSIKHKDFSPLVMEYQCSTPTSTMFVCGTILNVLENEMYGIMTASPRGHANRFEFAEKIVELANESGMFPDKLKHVRVKKDFTEPNYFIPATSCMNAINQTSHIGPDITFIFKYIVHMGERLV